MIRSQYVLQVFTLLFFSVIGFSASSANLPLTAENTCPIKVGQSLPDLTLHDIEGKAFDLNMAVAKKPTVLIFYRGGWCPYCNVHLADLRKIEGDLKEMGYQMLAISPDLPVNLKKSIEEHGLGYTLISDSKAVAATALGLAFKVDAKTYEKYLSFNINLEKASGETHHALPIPAAILLDTTGMVKFVFAGPDYKTRIDNDVLLAAAKSALKK